MRRGFRLMFVWILSGKLYTAFRVIHGEEVHIFSILWSLGKYFLSPPTNFLPCFMWKTGLSVMHHACVSDTF